jgi:sec-independent protein translocase protein TatC
MRLARRRLPAHAEATLVEHLDELRARLIVAIVAVVVGVVVGYVEHHRIEHALNAALPAHLARPVTLGVAEPFMLSLRISLVAGLLLALPVVLWQAWAFLSPALPQGGERTLAWLVVVAVLLLGGGVVFGYVIVLPAAVGFLTSYDSGQYQVMVRARDYYSFCTAVLLALGLVFEVPVFVLGLVRLGALSATTLRRRWREGLAAMAVLAVALPGVDPITTGMEMLPLMALYALTIGVATVWERSAAAAAARADPAGA